MSHIQCPKCQSREHYSGYGFAGGFFGAYTICECGALLEGFADCEGCTDEQAKESQEHVEALLNKTWGEAPQA